jgi:hypothetical protein
MMALIHQPSNLLSSQVVPRLRRAWYTQS